MKSFPDNIILAPDQGRQDKAGQVQSSQVTVGYALQIFANPACNTPVLDACTAVPTVSHSKLADMDVGEVLTADRPRTRDGWLSRVAVEWIKW